MPFITGLPRRAFAPLLMALFSLATAPLASAETWDDVVKAADKEATVSWYHNLRPAGIEQLIEAFHKVHPKVAVEEVRLGSGPLIERYASEYNAGRHLADVLMTFPDDRYFKSSKPGGWMAQWTPPELAAFPAGTSVDDTIFAVFGTREVLVWNKNQVKPADAPTEWTDLMDPKWKGKVGINPPWRSVSVQQIVAFWEDKGLGDTAAKFKANEARFFEGSGGVIQAVIRGDVLIAHLTDIQLEPALIDGAPIGFVYPKSGTTLSPGFIGVSRNAPHANAGKVFVNWLMSLDGQKALQEFGGIPGNRKDAPPMKFVPATSALSNAVDGTKILTPDRQKKIIDAWRTAFGVK